MDARAFLRYALVAAAVVIMGGLASGPASAQEPLMITITDSGISTSIDQPAGGLYNVTVRNDTSGYRGVVMRGPDIGASRYIRFSSVLAPGASQSFRWYFASDGTVNLRDLLRCVHGKMTCVSAGVGNMTKTVDFSQ